jgi:hypothetical protein
MITKKHERVLRGDGLSINDVDGSSDTERCPSKLEMTRAKARTNKTYA